MKIMSISMVKNESDIIESFIRYHANIFDEMIILDNQSCDQTTFIINKLIDEGFPIILMDDETNVYNQSIKLTELLKNAVHEYGADIVCVLDVDEFIISDNFVNPRKCIEILDSSNYYWVKWVTYVPTKHDNECSFIPKRITHIRDSNYESVYKVIVPKEIIHNYDVSLTMGSHDLFFSNKRAAHEKISDLKIAHFPIRSKNQLISKVSVGWPNMIAVNIENKSWGWHWKNIFQNIINNNDISVNELEDFSKYYGLEKCDEEIKIYNSPINLDFCDNIDIKYEVNYNYLNNILDNSVNLAFQVKNLKDQLIQLKKIK